MWIIANKKLISSRDHSEFEGYNLYSNQQWHVCMDLNVLFHYDGYVLIRGHNPTSKESVDAELTRLIAENKLKPEMIKGNYTLVVCREDSFQVISDRFGVQKWFYWQDGNSFIVSDDLRAIVSEVNPKLSKDNMALYALTYHFVNGKTIYDGILHNEPAQLLEFKDRKLTIGSYWSPLSLLEQGRQEIDIKEIVDCLGSHVDDLLAYCGKDSISLSLTGGADTRNLLALMLSRGIKPHLYTYGNPASCDCDKASKIARGLGLDHHIHDIKMNSERFREYSSSIISWGNSLSSIHRAHRIIAVEEESKFASTMFLGTLGGEFIKGVDEDYYIVSDVFFDNWEKDGLGNQDIMTYLAKKSVIGSSVCIDDLCKEINREFIQGTVIQRKLKAITHITAHLHDAQDIVLYQQAMHYLFTPFLDIDYLELIFSSTFPFSNKELMPNKIIRKIQNPFYASKFIEAAYPKLGKFRYSGEHKPNEILLNKYYGAIVREVRRKFSRTYPPNFPLGNWMRDFVIAELPQCKETPEINEVFDIDTMMKDLKNGIIEPKESFWLKYTNPIMMRYIVEGMESER